MRRAPNLLHLPGSNGVGVTDLARRLQAAPQGPGPGADPNTAPTGPTKTGQRSFVLVANVALQLAPANPYRRGLMLQNRDPGLELFYAFGQPADTSSFSLGPGAPGGSALLDFVCPTDAVWVFATGAVSGVFAEFARTW